MVFVLSATLFPLMNFSQWFNYILLLHWLGCSSLECMILLLCFSLGTCTYTHLTFPSYNNPFHLHPLFIYPPTFLPPSCPRSTWASLEKSAGINPLSLSISLLVVATSFFFLPYTWVLPTGPTSFILALMSDPFTSIPASPPTWLYLLSSSSVVTSLSWSSGCFVGACVISPPLTHSSYLSMIDSSLSPVLAELLSPSLYDPSPMVFTKHFNLPTPALYFFLSSTSDASYIYCSSPYLPPSCLQPTWHALVKLTGITSLSLFVALLVVDAYFFFSTSAWVLPTCPPSLLLALISVLSTTSPCDWNQSINEESEISNPESPQTCIYGSKSVNALISDLLRNRAKQRLDVDRASYQFFYIHRDWFLGVAQKLKYLDDHINM